MSNRYLTALYHLNPNDELVWTIDRPNKQVSCRLKHIDKKTVYLTQAIWDKTTKSAMMFFREYKK